MLFIQMLSRQLLDAFVAISSLFSMVMNAVKSFRPNVSSVLLVSLGVQQIGNMMVGLNLTSTKLDGLQSDVYIGASVLALCLTFVQLFFMILNKISERLRVVGA